MNIYKFPKPPQTPTLYDWSTEEGHIEPNEELLKLIADSEKTHQAKQGSNITALRPSVKREDPLQKLISRSRTKLAVRYNEHNVLDFSPAPIDKPLAKHHKQDRLLARERKLQQKREKRIQKELFHQTRLTAGTLAIRAAYLEDLRK